MSYGTAGALQAAIWERLAGDAARTLRQRRRANCFNPRPPLLAGDAKQPSFVVRTGLVSIRARHCWRAMRA